MDHAPAAPETSVSPPRTRTIRPNRRRREIAVAYLLLVPAAALTIGILVYPLAWEIWLSLTNFSVTHPTPAFVGGQNYARLAGDPAFWHSAGNTGAYIVVTSALKLALGVAAALLLARPFPGRALVFLAAFMPSAYPASVALIGWYWFLIPPVHASYTPAIAAARLLVDHNLGNGAWGFLSVVALNVYRGASFTGIFLLAALNSIPQELFDYAALEVRPGWRRFWLVTVPLLRPFLALAVFLSFTTAVTDLENVWFQSGQRIVYPIVWTQALRDALFGGAWGQASAAALILLPALAVALVACYRLFEPLEEDPA